MKKKRNSSDSNGVTTPLLGSNMKEDENEERIVEPFLPPDPENDAYPPNIIVTSRYSLVTFLPKTIFEQFRRLANVYFLVLGGIAAIGANTEYYDTAVEPAGLLIPMTIVVLISIIKDGVEDIKRHHTDNKTNNRQTRVVEQNGNVVTSQWKNLVVGSVLLLLGDDEVPADCVVLECGGVQGRNAYVETAAIDGETNLKLRLPTLPGRGSGGGAAGINDLDEAQQKTKTITITQDKSLVTGLDSFSFSASVEKPNGSIHRFNGLLEVTEHEEDGTSYRSQHPLTEKNLLLRGSVLRASEWAICLVVYTGKETKLSLNSKTPPSKLSVVDSVVNRTLIIAISAMLIVCIMSAIASIIWEVDNNNATYLCLNKDDLNHKYNGKGCESGATNSALTILTFATLFNNFVCISMYVSLEMTYLWQAYFISQDLILYDEISDSPAEAHTSGMCADLGQVQYILSDKTGTLTKNLMKLRRCSVAGMIFGEPMDNKAKMDLAKQSDNSKRAISFESLLSDGVSLWSPLTDLNRFRTLPPSADQRILLNFMRTMVLCNNAMLMPDKLTGELNVTDSTSLKACLEAESADEVALVLACAEHAGVILTKRDSSTAHVVGLDCVSPIDKLNSRSSDEYDGRTRSNTLPATTSKEECVEILAVNEFDSRRKRMSVVVRIGGGPPLLLCKGADSSMFPSCATGSYTTQCKEHIDDFASSGLRTLVMAKRDLTEEQFQAWFLNYKSASNSLINRPEMLQRVAEEIESNMSLLGAVGIEDELQDGVVNTIDILSDAGLNIWMITGDKTETAVAIGRMCGLLKPEHELELLLKLTGHALRQRLDDLVHFFEKSSRDSLPSQNSISTNVTQLLMKTFAYPSREIPPPRMSEDLRNDDKQRESMIDKTESLLKRQRTFRDGDTASGPSTQFLPSNFEDDSKSVATSFRSGGTRRPVSLSLKPALVVDGFILEEIWRDKGLLQKFITIARLIPTVIACRVSPLQKASLVRMIKTGAGSPVTLAIGDGANDIGMIHEAKIGIGICGNEGRHAANNADFAIGQFRFLAPLLLKHGRYNYIRSSKLVLYSFFKNLLLVSTLFYYSTFSGFSGTMPLESIVFSGYNFYLGLPIIAIGMMDADVSYENLLKYPALAYATGRNRELLNLSSMGRWCLSAFAEGSVLFAMVVRYIAGNFEAGHLRQGIGINNLEGKAGGIYVEGFVLFCCVILAMQFKVALMTSLWTWIHVLVWFLSIAGFLLFASVYSQIEAVWDWYHVVNFSFHQGVYWLSLLLIPIAIAMMDIFIDRLVSLVAPSSQHQLHEILNHELSNSSSTFGIDLLIPSQKFVEKEVPRGPSNESFGSGFNPDDGLKLSTTPSDEDSWVKSSH